MYLRCWSARCRRSLNLLNTFASHSAVSFRRVYYYICLVPARCALPSRRAVRAPTGPLRTTPKSFEVRAAWGKGAKFDVRTYPWSLIPQSAMSFRAALDVTWAWFALRRHYVRSLQRGSRASSPFCARRLAEIAVVCACRDRGWSLSTRRERDARKTVLRFDRSDPCHPITPSQRKYFSVWRVSGCTLRAEQQYLVGHADGCGLDVCCCCVFSTK